MLEVRLLGQFDIRFGGKPIVIHSRPAQSLMAYLVLNAGISQRREKLAGMFWPDTTEAKARSYLRQALWRIRKALTTFPLSRRDYIRTDDITVVLGGTAECWLDVDVVLERKDADTYTVEELIRIASIYRGELLPGFYDEWVYLERERLRAAYEHKMKLLLDRLLRDQRWEDVLHWGEHWIALGYASEMAYRALMIAHACMGDTSNAIAIFNRCVENLERELGVEPSPRTQAIHEQLVNGEIPEIVPTQPIVPERVLAEEPPVPGDPPFKGLQYFGEADADIFFGRETLTASLVNHLREGHSLLVVVGASGSGKSSIVRAGLVPALCRGEPLTDGKQPPKGSEDWLIHVITPTAHPLESLATSLTRDQESVTVTSTLMDDLARDTRGLHMTVERMAEAQGTTRLLLVVDQFEELFTLCRDEVERKAFIDNLLTAAVSEANGPTTVVITLRADFYERCSEYENLRQALAKHQEYIGPMTAREMRRAIEEPAKQGGWDFQPGLVDLFLRDVRGEPGALPLLSHALLETWHRRSGRMLTLKGYAASGGVPGAITRTAETVFNRHLTEEQQAIARKIFLRLTELGEGTQDTRRKAPLSELIPHPDEAAAVEEVIKKLADARLITTYEETAEVAHEALIREWPALREWLDEDRKGLRLHRHLTESAQEWEGLDRDPGELYRGARLAQTSEWAVENEGRLNELEREFLSASQIMVAEEEAAREAQRQRELEAARKLAETERKRTAEKESSIRRLRRLAIGLGGVLLIAIVAGTIAVQQRKLVEDEAHLLRSRELAAAAEENLHRDSQLSLLLALEAIREAEAAGLPIPLEAESAIHQAIQASPQQQVLQAHTDGAHALAFSPDGSFLASAGGEGIVRIWGIESGQELLTIPGHSNVVSGIAFSPDGRRIVTSSHDYTAKVWDSADGQELLTLTGHGDRIEDVAFSLDGKRIATASRDGSAKIWDSTSGEDLLTLFDTNGELTGIDFAPDGKSISTININGTTIIWDAITGEQIQNFSDVLDEVYQEPKVAYSPDGTLLATIGFEGGVTIWDVASGVQVGRSIQPHGDEILDIAFSPDGSRIAAASADWQVSVTVIDSGRHIFMLTGHDGEAYGVAFSPDGSKLATAGEDGTVRIWEISHPWEAFTISSPNGFRGVAYSPDGSSIAAGVGDDGLVVLWDAHTGDELITLSKGGHSARVENLVFSPDGFHLVTASLDGTVKKWDLKTGYCVLTFMAHRNGVKDVAFSPDGTQVITADFPGEAKIWEPVDVGGAERFQLLTTTRVDYGEGMFTVGLSPDGTRLATGNQAGDVRLWDTTTGEELLRIGVGWSFHDLDFSIDGTRLGSANSDGSATVWDAITGQEWITLDKDWTYLPGYHFNNVAIALSPDGKRVVTFSYLVKVWNAQSGQELFILSNPDAFHSQIERPNLIFSPEGEQLILNGGDVLLIYLMKIEDLVTLAESRLMRGFTNEECMRYLRPERCEPPSATPTAEATSTPMPTFTPPPTAPYSLAFKESVPEGFELRDPTYFGEVEGEVAVILKGVFQDAAYGVYASASLSNIHLGSYQLGYDLYLSREPNEETAVAVNLMMPDDMLRYKFFFRDTLDVQHWVNSQQTNDLYTQIPHKLKAGWNDVKLVIDRDAQLLEIYTNGDLILTFSNKFLDTTELLFETHSLEVYAIDNVVILTEE